MKNLKFLLFALVALSMSISCSGQSKKAGKTNAAVNKVEVYYFHFTHRCATCLAVESVSKDAVAKLYGNKVSFTSLNLDEKTSDAKAKEFGASGQTLLIVKGNKKINITNEGFMNARNNPEKLKAIIKEKIDPLL